MAETDRSERPPVAMTFLFTDIESSSMLWDRDHAAMRIALQRHDELVLDAAEACGGHVFSSGGDGFGIAFTTAGDGIDAAQRAQVALAREDWPTTAPIRVRMGLHTGVVETRDGNYFGTTVNRAARVADAGHGGQVLVSGVTAALIDPNLGLVDLGTFDLRGLQDPERIFWLPIAATGDRFPPLRVAGAGPFRQPPLPTRLRLDGDVSFAGRSRQLAQFADAWTATKEGGAPVVLVSGEPGVGKTRLVAEAVRRVHADGGTVLYGRCDPHLRVPQQAFSEALSTLADGLGRVDLREVLAPHRGELIRLIPRLTSLLPGLEPPLEGEASGNRSRLLGAVADALAALAERTSGVVLVIDDFHWADASTIELVEHLTLSAAPPGVMVVVIHRQAEFEPGDPVGLTYAALRRRSGGLVVHLGGLTLPEFRELVAAVGPPALQADDAAAADLYARSGGNPFFVTELLRTLASGPADPLAGERGALDAPGTASTPPGVRDLVRERLRSFTDETVDLLSTAAVFGQEFDLRFLARARGTAVDEALATLEPALSVAMVHSTGRGRFAFVHRLVRNAIYDGLPHTVRLAGHIAAAEAIQAVGHADRHWPELAYHWGEAAMAGHAGDAVTATLRAGRQAVRATAYDEGVEFFQTAQALLDDIGGDLTDRMLVQLDLAEALNMAARLDAAEIEFLDAAGRARRSARADLLARAALGIGGDLPSSPPPNPAAIALVEEALALHPDASATRALLLARLAEWCNRTRPVVVRRTLVDEAVDLARAEGDESLLARVMLSRVRALHGPDAMADMLAISREVDAVAASLADDALAVRSAQARMQASFALGDLGDAQQAARIISVLAVRLRQPEYERLPLMWGAFQAMYQGRFEAGSALAGQVAELIGGRHSQSTAIVSAMLMPRLVFEGQAELVYEMSRDLDFPYREALLAWYAGEMGAPDLARRHLNELGTLVGIVADSSYSFWPAIVGAATGAYLCGDTAILAEARDAIAPWCDQHATAGLVTYFGSGHHHLGVVELGLGNHEAAVHQLDQAVLAHQALGARPYVALSQIELARALEGRGRDGDAARATEVRAAALDAAGQLGLQSVIRRA